MRNFIKRLLGMEDGLCAQVRDAAIDLSKTANDLRRNVEFHEQAPDPFASMLGTMWNNREIERFPHGSVDVGKLRVYRRAPSN